jgi:hypothetical protein
MVVSAAIGDNPEGMSLKNIIVGLLTLIVLFCIFYGLCWLAWLIQSFFRSNYCFSRKLIKAINARQFSKVQQFVMNCPNCINKYPSLFSKERNLRKKRKVRYPLTEACYTNDLELVELLLSNGADPNCNGGLTPLMIAAKDSTPEMVRLLLDYGADKNCKSNEGKTAYDYAVEFDRKDNIPLLEN